MARPRAVEAPVSTPESAVGEVQCDYCQAPMPVPQHCIADGFIAGLLMCSQCAEDIISAATVNARAEMGLVGSGGGRP